jgi:hypothetical protein
MANKALSPKNIEDSCLLSLFANVMRFENPRSMNCVQAEMEEYGFLLFRVRCSMQQVHCIAPVWSSESSDSYLLCVIIVPFVPLYLVGLASLAEQDNRTTTPSLDDFTTTRMMTTHNRITNTFREADMVVLGSSGCFSC